MTIVVCSVFFSRCHYIRWLFGREGFRSVVMGTVRSVRPCWLVLYGMITISNACIKCVVRLYELYRIKYLVNVHMPKDRVTQMHQGYGFVEFMGEEDADYAIKVMNMIKLYGKPIRVNKVSNDDRNAIILKVVQHL